MNDILHTQLHISCQSVANPAAFDPHRPEQTNSVALGAEAGHEVHWAQRRIGLLQAGGRSDDTWQVRTGQRLELVPLANPATILLSRLVGMPELTGDATSFIGNR